MSDSKLNAAQTRALEMALNGDNMWIVGPPGTGKTFLNEFIRQKISANGKVIQMSAMTGTAASLMQDGITLHHFTGTGADSLKMHLHHFPKAADFLSEKVKDFLKKTDTLVIDEASMLGTSSLQNLDTFLCKARENPEEDYGGIQIILVGDVCQLPPVDGTLSAGIKRSKKIPQECIFRFPKKKHWKVAVLSDFVRQAEDPLLQNINLASINASSAIRKQAVEILNKKCYNQAGIDLSTDKKIVEYALKHGIPILTPTNKRVDEYIKIEEDLLRKSRKKAYEISKPFKLYDPMMLEQWQIDFLGGPKGVAMEDQYVIDRHSFEMDDLVFFEDQIVLIRKNGKDKNDISFMNGDRCIFKSYDPEEEIVLVKRARDGAIIHLPRFYHLSEWSKQVGNIGYNAFPLIRAIASNVHKNQGQTLEKIIVDPFGLHHFGENIPQMMNVMFSRVRRLSDIYLTRFVAKSDVEKDGIDENLTSLWNLSYMKDYPKVDKSVLDAHSA